MPVIPTDSRALSWRFRAGLGSFQPLGPRIWRNDDRSVSPGRWDLGKDVLSARLILSLEPGAIGRAAPNPDYVLDTIVRVRAGQSGETAPIAFAQTGHYIPAEPAMAKGAGMHAFVFAPQDTTRQVWTQQAVGLAETLAREFDQPEVVVQLQANGLPLEVSAVVA